MLQGPCAEGWATPRPVSEPGKRQEDQAGLGRTGQRLGLCLSPAPRPGWWHPGRRPPAQAEGRRRPGLARAVGCSEGPGTRAAGGAPALQGQWSRSRAGRRRRPGPTSVSDVPPMRPGIVSAFGAATAQSATAQSATAQSATAQSATAQSATAQPATAQSSSVRLKLSPQQLSPQHGLSERTGRTGGLTSVRAAD
jgi:hypothetical protein